MKFNFFAITLFATFFLQQTVLSGQSRFTSHYRFGVVVNGLFGSDSESENRYTKTNLTIPGLSFTVGGQYGYYLNKNKNLQINLSTLLEYRSFTRFNAYEYNTGSRGQNRKSFQITYFTVPIELEFHFKKFSLSGGLVNTLNLWTKSNAKYCWTESEEECEYRERYSISYVLNGGFEAGANFLENVYTQRRYSLEYTLGISFNLKQRSRIKFEFRNFILDNILHYEYLDWDIFADEHLKLQTNSLHLSFLYKIK